jgi:hypothetical protein
LRARVDLVVTDDGRVVPDGVESGTLWRIAGDELSEEEALRYALGADVVDGAPGVSAAEPERVAEPEVRRTRRRART